MAGENDGGTQNATQQQAGGQENAQEQQQSGQTGAGQGVGKHTKTDADGNAVTSSQQDTPIDLELNRLETLAFTVKQAPCEERLVSAI